MELEAYGHNKISIHALREEGDEQLKDKETSMSKFLSTPSARRATCAGEIVVVLIDRFLSTPSARRATVNRRRHDKNRQDISIHALREEGDGIRL